MPKSTNEDMVKLLDDNEALEIVEFYPTIEAPTTWTPSEMMAKLLERTLTAVCLIVKRIEILSDFPKPNIPVLVAQSWMMMLSKNREGSSF